MRARLPDPERSRVVLIGVPTYTYLDDLPAVERNVRRLRELFSDSGLWGLPEQNCTIVLGEDDPRAVPRAIRAAARGAEKVLMVYYAGHGLLPHDSDKFCLALPSSTLDDTYTAIRYEDVRHAMAEARPDVTKVMVLDCCFAARALEGAMGVLPSLSELARIEGACTLTACDETSRALASPGDTYTAFTGEFIGAIEDGIAGAAEYLDLGTIFHHVRLALEAKALPQPQFFTRGDGGAVPLFRNRAYSASSPVTKPSGFVLPEALRDMVRAQLRAADDFPYQLVGARKTSLASVYVRQEVSAAPPEGTSSDDLPAERQSLRTKVTDTVRAVEDALRFHSHLVITGGPGQGKSTLTLQLTAHLANALISRDKNEDQSGLRLVPVRVTAAALAARDGPLFQRLRDAAAAGLGLHLDTPLPDQLLKELPDGWRWLVLVDGLDEITDPTRREALIRQLAARTGNQTDSVRLLITTRPLRDTESALLRRSGVGLYRLEPFSRERLRDFSERWFSDPAESAGFLHAASQAGPNNLVRIPLLATITAIVYEQRPGSTLPANRYVLYQNYLSYLQTARAEATDEQWRHIRNRIKSVPGADLRPLDYLRANLQELLAQLAETAVEGTSDLGPRALEWIDRHGGGTQWVAIPEWPGLVAGLLDSTGLFVHTAEGQRFIHHSFAEHLAGKAAARRIPEEFDPERAEWAEPLRRAVDGDHVAMTALIARSHGHPDTEALLEWAERGDGDRRALTGRLLAEGIRTLHSRQHAARFLEFCQKRLRARNVEYSEHNDLLEVASKLGYDAATAFLREVATGPAYPPSARIKAASVLPPAEVEAAAAALRVIAAMPRLSEQNRSWAARSLARLGPRYVGEAVAIVRAVIDSPRSDTSDRVYAADDLAAISPEHADQAAAILRQIMNDPRNSHFERAHPADWFAKLGHSQEAAETLEEILASPRCDQFARCYAAEQLALIAPAHTDATVTILQETMTDAKADPSARAYAAWRLTRLRPGPIDEAVKIIRSLIASPNTPTDCKVYAASILGDLKEEHSAEAIAVLRQIMNDPANPAGDRAYAARCLTERAREHLDESQATIRLLLDSPRCDAQDRVAVAKELADLGPEQTDEAVEVLQHIADCPDDSAVSRANAARELAKLAPDRAEQAVDTLRQIITDPHSSPIATSSAARHMAMLGPEYLTEATQVLQRIIDSPHTDTYDRAYAARDLAQVSPKGASEAAETLRHILEDPGTGPYDRAAAARFLANISPEGHDKAVSALRSIISSSRTGASARASAADDLAVLEPNHLDEPLAVLLAIAEDPDVKPARRSYAAGLMPNCRRAEEAATILHSLTTSPQVSQQDAIKAARQLAQVQVSPRHVEYAAGVLRTIMTGPGPLEDLADAAAELGSLNDSYLDEATQALRALTKRPPTDFSGCTTAAQHLAKLAPDHRSDAAAVIRAVAAGRVSPFARRRAAMSLAQLGSEYRDEAATVLRDIITSEIRPTYQARAAAALGNLSPLYRDEAADALRETMNSGASSLYDKVTAAGELADLSPAFTAEAAEVMRKVIEALRSGASRWSQGASWATTHRDRFTGTTMTVLEDLLPEPLSLARGLNLTAKRLAWLGPAFVDEGAAVIRGIIADPGTEPLDRADAGDDLTRVNAEFVDEGLAVVDTVLAGPGLRTTERIYLAPLLITERQSRFNTAIEILRGIISDLDADPADRAYAAYQLADLGQGYTREGIAVLQEVMADSTPATSAYAVGKLAELDTDHVVEAAELVRAVISAPSSTASHRILAAAVLSDLSLGHPDEATRALQEVLTDSLLDESDHDLAITVLAEISPRSADQYRSRTLPPPTGDMGKSAGRRSVSRRHGLSYD